MNDKLKLAVIGASGKLGKEICDQCTPFFQLTAAIVRQSSPLLNSPSLPYTSDLYQPNIDLYIDVSTPAALPINLQAAVDTKRPLVIGTTGLSKNDFASIHAASQTIPIFYSPNFSIGMAIFQKAIALTSSLLPSTTDIDLIETHHTHKKDAPSGSALLLKSTIENHSHRPISIHSIRSGNTVGKHELHFNLGDEVLTLIHTANSRKIFASGALKSALFLAKKQPGFYGMEELLGSAQHPPKDLRPLETFFC